MRRIPAKYRHWILEELPRLEQGGTIDGQTRENLRTYYQNRTTNRTNWGPVALAILGALLIGGGILLLFGHNWETLSRGTRAVLSICPLLLAVALSFVAVKKSTAGLNEAAGIFHSLAIGASIALIGQTYHLPGDAPAFFLGWALLVMPLIFLLLSTGAYLFYIGLIGVWNFAVHGHTLGFWILLAPAIVRVVQICKQDRHSPESLLSIWGLMTLLSIELGFSLDDTMPGTWILAYSALFGIAGLLGSRYYPDGKGWRNPLDTVGFLGLTVLCYIFTWQEVWYEIGWSHRNEHKPFPSWSGWSDIGVAVALLFGWAILAVRSFGPHTLRSLIFSLFPVIASVAFLLTAAFEANWLSALSFNVSMLVLGFAYLVEGCRSARLRQVNFGMAVIGLLVFTRFFDSGFSFLAKGVVFILLGGALSAINLLISRQRRNRENGKGSTT